MGYVSNEFKTILHNKKIIASAIVLLIANIICLFLYVDSDEIDSQIYKNYSNQIIQENTSAISLLADNPESVECQEIFAEYNSVSTYQDYIDKVIADAEKNKNVSLFQDNYSIRLNNKTEKDYEILKDVNVTYVGSYGMSKVLKYPGSFIFVMILGVIIVFELVMRDKKNSLLNLYKSTKNGDKRLLISKYISAMTIIVLFYMVIYICNIFITNKMFGHISLDVPVQCIKDYYEIGYHITLGQFLVINFGCVITYVFMLIALMFLVAISSNNEAMVFVKVFLTAVAAMAVSIMLKRTDRMLFYDFFSGNVLNTAEYLQYRHYNIFNYPINSLKANGILFVALTFVFLTLTGRYYESSEMYYKAAAFRIRLHKGSKYKTASILQLEADKLLFGYKMIFILFALVILQLYVYSNKEVRWSKNEIYYKAYMTEIEGSVTQEKIDYLKQEDYRYQELEKQMEALEQKERDGKISERLYNEQSDILMKEMDGAEGFYRCLEYANYIIDEYESRGEDNTQTEVGFVYNRGYNLLFGINSKNQILDAIILLAACIVIFPYIYLEDYKYKINELLQTTPNKKRLKNSKLIISIVLFFGMYASVYLTEMVWICDEIGLNGMNYNIKSIMALGNTSMNISVLEYILIVNIVRILIITIILYIMLQIGKRIKNSFVVIIAAVILLLVPLGLAYMNVSDFDNYIINRLVVGELIKWR